MKQKSTIQVNIDDVMNIGEAEVEWSVSLEKTSTGFKVKIEIPDQIINLPTLNLENDSFNDWETAPVALKNNYAQIFSLTELEGENSINLSPEAIWVDWNKKNMAVTFSEMNHSRKRF